MFRRLTKEYLPWLKTGQPFAAFVLVQQFETSAAQPARRGLRAMATDVSGEAVAVSAVQRRVAEGTAFSIILALSFSHMLNDMMQSLVPALYPMIKSTYNISFVQVGIITLAMQVTSSMLQPVVGLV